MGSITKATMQDFVWDREYNAVFMVWVSGYLDDQSLVDFLKRAKAQLDQTAGPSKRRTKPGSFIFVLDNVLGEGEVREPEKGQRFRTVRQLENVFAEAALLVHDQSGRKTMPGNRLDVELWALY